MIFPGHPLVIACQIMKYYPDLKEAYLRTERNCPKALEDQNIEGAGGCVYSALDALRYVTDGHFTIDRAVEWCNETWGQIDGNKSLHPEKYNQGLEEASEYEAVFRGMLKGRGYA